MPLVIVLAALAFAAWNQGAYYGHQFATVEVALAFAAGLAVAMAWARRGRLRIAAVSAGQRARRHTWRDHARDRALAGCGSDRGSIPHRLASFLRAEPWWAPSPVVAAAVGLGATTLLTSLLHHDLRQASSTFGILAAGAVVAALVAQASSRVHETVLAGLVGVGGLVAVTGWWGVVNHRQPWSLVDGGLWRAASSITYANATAAVCVPLALVALSQLVSHRSSSWSVAAMILLTGAAATLSRAGALAFAIGLAVLVAYHGIATLVGVGWPPIFGALLATAGLSGSFATTHNSVATPGRPGPAAVGAVGGIVLTIAGTRYSSRKRKANDDIETTTLPGHRRRRRLILAGFALAAAGLAGLGMAKSAVGKDRLSAQSPDRTSAWQASWDLARSHPWTGVGPGPFAASWTTSTGDVLTAEYTHNEYLQLVAQEGVLGGGALVIGLGAMAWSVWRRRPRRRAAADKARLGRWVGVVAALSALAVHSSFDFLWHIPVIPLIGAALVGIVISNPTTEVSNEERHLS